MSFWSPIALALTLALTTPAKAPKVPAYVQDVVDRWAPLDIDVKVVAEKCGQDNAWYAPEEHRVTLCTELFDRPELTRFVLNHELAHAFDRQHGIDWGHDEEFKADELAFMMSSPDEVQAGIKWFLSGPFSAGDDHPADVDRAAMLMCLDVGWRGEDRMCATYYRSAYATWAMLIVQTERG